MKKYFPIVILSFCLTNCKNQPKLNKDELVTQICNSFKNDTISETASLKVPRIFQKHIDPYLQQLSRDSVKALRTFIFIRLQRECLEFRTISKRLLGSNNKSDWMDAEFEPESEIADEDFKTFFQLGDFKYLEVNGDTAKVHLTDSTWEDHFIDGTYSRLSLRKINQREFVITFIESNNELRKNFSKPGDEYRYKILKKEGTYFSMFVQPVGSEAKSLFRLYY